MIYILLLTYVFRQAADDDDEAELAKIKARMQEMEAEAEKLKMLQQKQNEKLNLSSTAGTSSALPRFQANLTDTTVVMI